MKIKVKNILAITAGAFLAIAAFGGAGAKIKASANSAPSYWSGTAASGAIVSGGQSPVVVEHELLTFSIEQTPEKWYASWEELEGYTSRVTAEYHLYNPTDTDVEMELVFPFGARPDYLYGVWSDIDFNALYRVTVDGETVERELRHTYLRNSDWRFDADDTYLIADVYRKDIFYDIDLECRYHVLDMTLEEPYGDEYFVEVTMHYNPTRTHIFVGDFRDYYVESGDLVLVVPADGTFLSVGEEPEFLATRVLKYDTGWNSRCTVVKNASAKIGSDDVLPFIELLENYRPETVSEVDFYNAAIDYLSGFSGDASGLVTTDLCFFNENALMRWYKYQLTIPAGGRLVNTVTAPLYPAIDYYGDYDYTYYLSPAHRWADFGTLEIVIDTPFEISIYRNTLEFEKTDTGYHLVREGLPLCELSFFIEGELGLREGALTAIIAFLIIVAATFLIFTVVVAGVVVLITVLMRKKRNRN